MTNGIDPDAPRPHDTEPVTGLVADLVVLVERLEKECGFEGHAMMARACANDLREILRRRCGL